MKKFTFVLLASLVALCVVSCKNGANTEDPAYDGVYSFQAKVTVPLATNVLFVEYTNAAGQTQTAEISVSPEMERPADGKNPEPFGWVNFSVQAKVPTVANVYYMINGQKVSLLDNIVINTPVVTTKGTDPTAQLSEPKEYETADLGQTFYHSSGAVMFEDSFPNVNRVGTGAYDSDFDDVIIDYDVEAVVVPDALLAEQGWREQVKAVIHVRGVGGAQTCRVGMILEGFDQQYVESIETHCSLDSWQNPHGTLPSWTEGTLQENSLHYETNPLRPCIEIGGIQRINEKTRGAGTEEYQRVDDKGTTHMTVFNPKLNGYWSAPKTEQYDPALPTMALPVPFSTVQGKDYYNTIPGYVNVDGGLYTFTVIYHMKPRVDMSAAEKAASLENMLKAVYTTTNQNFYIINKDYRPIGLKGYQPGDFKVKGYNSYKARFDEVVAANSDLLLAGTTYCSKEGYVWAIKCPTLTKHVWNKLYFSSGYPHYENWVATDGAEDKDWYLKDVDGRYLTCWW